MGGCGGEHPGESQLIKISQCFGGFETINFVGDQINFAIFLAQSLGDHMIGGNNS